MLDLTHSEANTVYAKQRLQNLGVVKALEVSLSWRRRDRCSPIGRAVVLSRSSTPKTEITLLERRVPLDQHSARIFCDIVHSSSRMMPLVLYRAGGASPANLGTIKALSSAFGANQVGDNQVSAPQVRADSRRPAFHLDSAGVETINGKTVIAVEGWFSQLDERAEIKMDWDGPAKRFYSGIFFSADANAQRVSEIYVIADNKTEFVSGKAAFRTMLRSIQWH